MIRQEIWEEMKKAKTYQLSCLYYVDKKRKFNRIYNMWIIGLAAIGAPTFFISHWCAFVTTIAASVLEVIKSFIPAVCQSEEDRQRLMDLPSTSEKRCKKSKVFGICTKIQSLQMSYH